MIGEIINERDLGIGEIHANGKELTSSSLDMLNEKATKKLSKLLHDFSDELIGEDVIGLPPIKGEVVGAVNRFRQSQRQLRDKLLGEEKK